MWFIITFNPKTSTSINTSSFNVATPHPGPTSETFHTISQLTTFGLWKRVDSLPNPLGWYHNPNLTPSCDPSARDGRAAAPLTM